MVVAGRGQDRLLHRADAECEQAARRAASPSDFFFGLVDG